MLATQQELSAREIQSLRLSTHAERVVAEARKDPEGYQAEFPSQIVAALEVLTPKQRKLAVLIGGGMSDIHAYKETYDYREDRPDSDLWPEIVATVHNPRVMRATSLIQSWVSKRWLLDASSVKEFAVSNLYELSSRGKGSDRIQATKLLLQAHGQLTDKKEIIHRDGADLDATEEIAAQMLVMMQAALPTANQTLALSAPNIGATCCPHCKHQVSPAELLPVETVDLAPEDPTGYPPPPAG